jgi:hypothetical protein
VVAVVVGGILLRSQPQETVVVMEVKGLVVMVRQSNLSIRLKGNAHRR